MSNLKHHGLHIDKPNHGIIKFGIVELIRIRQSFLWSDFPNITSEQKSMINRFNKRAYWQCSKKCNETVDKLNTALYKLGNCLLIAENEDKYSFDGAPLETAAIYLGAMKEIPYHLDAFISYLRILVDCISFALPYFYDTSIHISTRSFRDQYKWFVNTNPNFDPEYTKILKEQINWFDLLAGKTNNGVSKKEDSEKGIRDVNFHNFGTYQIITADLPNGKHKIQVSQAWSQGIIRADVLGTLEDLIEDFFVYLDQVYELFVQRFSLEIPEFDWFAPANSIFVNIEMPDIQSKYRFYPIIEN